MAPPLPDTTALAFSGYLNQNLQGDGGTQGAPVAALHQPGLSLGEQWLAWYAQARLRYGGTYTLVQYEQAFIVLWEDVTLNGDLSQAEGSGAYDVGLFADSIPQGLGNTPGAKGLATTATAVGNAATGINAIGDFFQRLTQAGTWVRAAEVLIGAALLLAGLNHVLGNPAGKAAKTAAKGAALL
jgi:hypothetical protein